LHILGHLTHFALCAGLPLALHVLELTVAARQKIGICGRTGAGKSSVMAALFRLFELEAGRIVLDGVESRGRQSHSDTALYISLVIRHKKILRGI
jgi:ABC-type multidrug transport system fused ATPase/permease subunit